MAAEPPNPGSLLDDISETISNDKRRSGAQNRHQAPMWPSQPYKPPHPSQPPQSPQPLPVTLSDGTEGVPFLEIVEQPIEEIRFRYQNEGRAVLRGRQHGTNPKVKIRNFIGAYNVRASLVTDENNPRPHPHRLTGTNCSYGVWTISAPNNGTFEPTFELESVGLAAMRMRMQAEGSEIIVSLRDRQLLNVDPFNTNDFSGKLSRAQIHSVRICFEVTIFSNNEPTALDPIVTEPILNQRHIRPSAHEEAANPDVIEICRIVPGNVAARYPSEICLFTTPLGDGTFHVCFYIGTVFSGSVQVQRSNIHRNCAVIVAPPRLPAESITNQPVVANVYLRRDQPDLDPVFSQNLIQIIYEPSPYTANPRSADRQPNPRL